MESFKYKSYKFLEWIEVFGLLVIAIMTLIAMINEIWLVVLRSKVELSDLLLLFMFLEVLAMVGIYLKSGKLPVRIPMYIVIVALARHMALEVQNLDTLQILGLACAILILSIAVLVIRYGHLRLPYNEREKMRHEK